MQGVLSYWLTEPAAIIYRVSTLLLHPVLIAEVAALLWALVEAGRLTVEWWTRLANRKHRSLEALHDAAATAQKALEAGKADDAAAALAGIAPRAGLFLGRYVSGLAAVDLDRTRLLKRLADLEIDVERSLDRTRALVRIGPMLGLMGTLIPMSPALVALAKGDVQTLSDNLVIAFSTTVVGLFIGGIGFVSSMLRDRYYSRDVSDIEYVLEVTRP